MIITSEMMKNQLSDYSNKSNKISREMAKGKLIQIKKGLYETNPNVPGFLLASEIYGPSYLSFDYALSYYGMIPEKVETYTCATFEKKKKKQFDTCFGTYTYRDVPESVYRIGIKRVKEEGYEYQIATPEKALCDKLYTLKPIKSMNTFTKLLLEDLHVNEKVLSQLNLKHLKKICNAYHATNVSMLYKFLTKS